MSDPKILSKSLGQRLRALRRSKGINSTQTLEKLMGGKYSYSNISRRETGHLRIDSVYLADFCKALKLSREETERVMTSARINRLKPERMKEADAFEWVRLVMSGHHYQYYNADVVCYYLQTPGYMRSIISLWDSPSSDVEKTVSQRVINSAEAISDTNKAFRIILHENALYYSVGSPTIMVEQLERLLQFVDEPRVELRILPKATFVSAKQWQSFSIVDMDFSFSENRLDISISDEVSVTRNFQSDFDLLWSHSVIGIRRNEIVQQAIRHYKVLKNQLRAGVPVR